MTELPARTQPGVSAPCSVPECPDPATCRMQNAALCTEHFLSTCYDLVGQYERAIREQSLRDLTSEAVRSFLLNSTRQAIDLAHGDEPLENLQRARLLDLLMRAADLARHLRRSPRRELAIPLRLRCERLGHAWEEDTATRIVSRYGALLSCTHDVEAGSQLTVTRLDERRETRARVAWVQHTPAGCDLGIELLKCDNFWGLDWSEGEIAFYSTENLLDLNTRATAALERRADRGRRPSPPQPFPPGAGE